MKRRFAIAVFAGILAFSPVPVHASGLEEAARSAAEQILGSETDLSDLSGFLNKLNPEALIPDGSDLSKIDIDALLQRAKESEFLKNLDVSSLNLDAALGMLQDTDILKNLGLQHIDTDALQEALRDTHVSDTINQLMSTASQGGKITDSIKALAKDASLQEMFTKITGEDLSSFLAGLKPENLKSILPQAAAAVCSPKTGESSGTAGDLEALLQNGLNALMK